ncbi:hypothetical protein C8Q74DRAFT_335252 [Fomes fomentarius]|nr:hypothetical protein C8Q74DRAFT_335252 [Fomes fomentarius]
MPVLLLALFISVVLWLRWSKNKSATRTVENHIHPWSNDCLRVTSQDRSSQVSREGCSKHLSTTLSVCGNRSSLLVEPSQPSIPPSRRHSVQEFGALRPPSRVLRKGKRPAMPHPPLPGGPQTSLATPSPSQSIPNVYRSRHTIQVPLPMAPPRSYTGEQVRGVRGTGTIRRVEVDAGVCLSGGRPYVASIGYRG